ncbi:hypothetical protein [Vulcanisaeta thermophila]|uniref:hypothetical protein n=1 Tax=Vulcanisaeta thermophila TaxID=867917 RepID=UPI000853C6EF|nr:hypothetical protein [Vulcanisaeta thermophila]
MALSIPPEPHDIKERIIKRRGACSGEGCDRFAVWFGNELASYLWSYWSRELRRMGITWQGFLELLGRHTQELIDWAIRGSITWDSLVNSLINELKPGSGAREARGGILDFLR